MLRNQAASTWVSRGLMNPIEGLYLQDRMQRQGDTPASALALAGFKDTAPFLQVLDTEARQGANNDDTQLPANPLYADMTFKTFIQTNSFMSAVELVFRVCRDSPYQSKFPAICGGEGQGKTHLLHATEQEVRRVHPERRTALVNMSDLAIALSRARRRGTRSDFIGFLSRIDTLLIDDIQLCEADSQIQANLLEVMEKQSAEPGQRLVLSCDVKPAQLQLGDSRLKSILENITMVELKPLDRVERGMMVRKLAGDVILPVEVRTYIAENVTGNVRELKSAVMQLIAAAARGEEINLALTRELLRMSTSSQPPKLEPAGSQPEGAPKRDDNVLKNDPKLLKQMVRSAQNKEEHILANQIVLSHMLRIHNSTAADRPLMARLQLALQAIREGDLTTASELIQGQEADGGQEEVPATAAAPATDQDDKTSAE